MDPCAEILFCLPHFALHDAHVGESKRGREGQPPHSSLA